jgi:hypothetical protein
LRARFITAAACVLGACAAFIVPLLHLSEPIGRDWNYFNPQSLFIKSLVWHYGSASFHNPYLCAGLDLLANPQTRVFSPFGLLDLLPLELVSPYAANLLPMVVCAALGLYGGVHLLRELGASRLVAFACAFVFVDGSWFALHLAEGHVPFATMQLLPCVALCGLHFSDARYRTALAALLVVCLLDGGVYAAIFSVYLLLTLWLAFGRPALRLPRTHTALIVLAVVAAALVRAIPTLATGMHPNSQRDFVRVWPSLLVRAFFDPRQFGAEDAPVASVYAFHEIGCYLGVPLLTLFVYGLIRHRTKTLVRLSLGMLVWLWIGTGLGNDFNPWAIHRVIPIINVAHVQSRGFIVLFALLATAAALILMQLGPKTRAALCVLLVCESLGVRWYTWSQTLKESPEPALTALITNDTIAHTIERGEMRPQTVYAERNLGARNCYEPSYPLKRRVGLHEDDVRYRGEAWIDGGRATLLRYTPGTIVARYEADAPSVLRFNTNTLAGWTPSEGTIVSSRGELLAVQTAHAAGTITLAYRPAYRYWQLGVLVLAFLLLAAGARSAARDR